MSHKPPHEQYVVVSEPGGNDGGYWIDALGQIAFFFGQIEWCSYWLIDGLAPSPEQAKAFKKLGIKERSKRAKEMVIARLDATLAKEWVDLLEDAVGVAGKRNDVLHNPVVVTTGVLSAEHSIELQEHPGGFIHLAEAQQFARKLSDLALRVVDLMRRTSLQTPP